MRVQVKDFMVTAVVTSVSDKKIKEIRELMNYHGVSAIPIIEYSKQLPENKLIIKGIISASDLNRNIDEDIPCGDIMTTTVHVVHQDSSAQAAAKMMIKHSVHHIVVMDEGKIVGIVSSVDFVRLVADHSLE